MSDGGMDFSGGKNSNTYDFIESSRLEIRKCIDTLDEESCGSLDLSQSDNLTIFVNTWDNRRIRMVTNLQTFIIDLRKNIYAELGISTNYWCLSSCGGRLYSDKRTLAYYGIRENDTLFMRLLLKGGAPAPKVQSRKRTTPWNATNRTKQFEQPKRTIAAMPRRSARLSI